MTLLLAGVFGTATGAAPNWIATCALYACMGLGVGGNLPVDGALFLEFIPFASGNLLTVLSIWWPVGQLAGSLRTSTLPSKVDTADKISCMGFHSQLPC